MKRLILFCTVTLILMILVSGSAFATLGRIRSLGNADYYFKDIYHIYTNPAYLGLYTNSVYGELGTYQGDSYTPENQFLGINYKVYKGLSLGLTLNRQNFWDPRIFDEFGKIQNFPLPMNEYDFLASYDFEKFHLGASLYHAGNKWEETTKNGTSMSEEMSSGTTTLTGGFLFDLNESNCLEGMLRLNFDRAEDSYRSGSISITDKTDGGNGIEFGARGFFEATPDFQVVPLLVWSTETISLKHTEKNNNYSTGDLKMSYFLLALGGNLKLEKGMVAGGINLTRSSDKDERDTISTYESTDWSMPGFNLGVEYELTKWLVGRVGMEKDFGKYETKSDYSSSYYTIHYDTKGRYTSSSVDFIGLGVGFKFSKFKVDATVGDNNFFEGSYIASGVQRNLFGILSAIFEF
jgi:hypothetical protein